MRIPNPESVDFNILSSEGFSGFGMVKELGVVTCDALATTNDRRKH